MATRFMCKTLVTAALGISLSLLFAAPTTASPASSYTAEALQLDPPAAPSRCRIGHFTDRDPRKGDYTFYYVSWRDNSINEDGFTLETWWRNQSGEWVLVAARTLAANSTRAGLGGRPGPDYRFRVKAFNASGDSAWSDWAN
jgi:hypothetical protein